MNLKISGKTITLDTNQIEVLKQLNHLSKQITKSLRKNPTRLVIKSFFKEEKPIKNLYIYGQVGRGKSMLAKYFLENVTTSKKIYFHFNFFMQEIHKELYILRKNHTKTENLIHLATAKIVGDAKVICFDEMQVEDVADAMILKEVFSYFIDNKIAIVTTSNRHPLDLYENGLQRDLFLKFVKEILLPNFSVLNLDGKIDYRGQFIDSKRHYFYPINSDNQKEVLNLWENLIAEDEIKPKEIEVLGRKIHIKKSYKNIAFFDFKELCLSDMGVADYGAITNEFSIIFLVNVPSLKSEDRNEAKRLIWFIDEAYERKVKLVVLADAKPEELYLSGTGSEAFKRTASRLNEICFS